MPKLVQDTNEIRIVSHHRKRSALFFRNGKFFSTEEPIAPAGNEIFVNASITNSFPIRRYSKGSWKIANHCCDGDTVNSGERIETMLTIEAEERLRLPHVRRLKACRFRGRGSAQRRKRCMRNELKSSGGGNENFRNK